MKIVDGLDFLRRFDNFWDLVVRRITSKYRDVAIYDLPSGPVIVDRAADDDNGVWACLHAGEYDSALCALPQHLCMGAPIRVLDCGANAGGFGILLANRGFNFKQYHAVEMNPRAFGRAAFNLTNWREHPPAQLLNAAVADECGWVKIQDVFGDTGQSIYRPISNADESPLRVPKTTIGILLSKQAWPDGLPDLIKLDVEGAEFDIIPQFTFEMLAGTSAVIVEIHPLRQLPARELVLRMMAFGFDCCLRPQGEWGVYVFCRGPRRASAKTFKP